jgi:nucleotide-binding universal stress UspA family protein
MADAYPSALVMLALDERDPAVIDAVIAGAARLGVRRLTVAHVSARAALPPSLLAGIHLADPAPPPALEAAADRLRAALPGVPVDAVHHTGSPADALATLVDELQIDLFVMGRRPCQGDAPAWGPNGRKLLQIVSCSVLVVPAGAQLDGGRAVAGLDFSRHAADALRAACRVADEVDAVCQYDPEVTGTGALTEAEFVDALRANAAAHFEEDVRPLLPAGAAPRLRVEPGPTASEVLVRVAGDDLLVIGSRGLSRIAALVLGSTAEALAGRARGPVLIVREKGTVIGLLEGLARR